MLDAWHLTGFDEPDDGWLEGHTASGEKFRAPALTGTEAARVAAAVREAALESRSSRSTADVIGSVASAASRICGEGPEGVAARELLRMELGWDERLIAETLAGMAATWSSDALAGIVEAELGGLEALDGFTADLSWTGRGQRYRRALGPPIILQVLAGSVPGVAITATIRALLVRSGVLCKLPEAEPGLLPLFARVLADEDPLLGRGVAATWWPGASFPAAWREWIHRAGKTVVYGGGPTVEAVRAATPADTEVVVYGPRTGVAVILPDGPATAAAALARDICAYDQQGCVSPRLVYVVGERWAGFVDDLASELSAWTGDHPPPVPSAEEAVAIRAARAAFEFGGYEHGRTGVEAPGEKLTWTVLHSEDPAAHSENLPRVAWVHPVSDLTALEDLLRPLEGRIQSFGYSGSEGLPELAGAASRLAASRVAPLGTMAWPPADWRHEGRHQLLPLINWTDLEITE
ncbi:MAG: hypothetical protein M8866_05930 [marine benthic group bacterium]|nr:hypothetical protein [Candidatus Benthicola marisminoris]